MTTKHITADIWFGYSDGSAHKALSGVAGPDLAARARRNYDACQADETYPTSAWFQASGTGLGSTRWDLEEMEVTD